MKKFAVIALVVLGLIAGGWLLYEQQRKAKFAEERAIENICQGSGVADAATYSDATSAHPLVFVEVGRIVSDMDSYNYKTPEELRFNKIDELELVVCIEEEEAGKEIERCPYTLENGEEIMVVRVQKEVIVTLVKAQTGETIATSDAILGGMPAECLDTISVDENIGSGTLKSGSAPSVEAIMEWVQPYAETP